MSDASTSAKTVGLIGLGAMGQGLGLNLAKQFRTLGCDRVPELTEKAAAHGVEILPDANAVFAAADVVVLSLPTEEVVAAVIADLLADGRGAHRGLAIFDTSTTTPKMAETLATQCAEAGMAFLDAPVTGGAWGAERGELSIMVGGDAAAFAAHEEVLAAMGNLVTRIGPSGHGQVAKMVNQMLMAAIYTSVNEAFGFAVQHGADIAKVFRAVEGGGGRSMLLNKMKGPMLAGTTHDDWGLRQHGKDIRYAVQSAAERGIELPITAGVHAFFEKAQEVGLGMIWAGEMWAVWEKLYGVNFKDTIGQEDRGPSTSGD